MEAPGPVAELGEEPVRRGAHRRAGARVDLSAGRERQRRGPSGELVPRLRRRPLLLHRHGRHGLVVRRDGLPYASARRPVVDDQAGAGGLQGDHHGELQGRAADPGQPAGAQRPDRRAARSGHRPRRPGALHRAGRRRLLPTGGHRLERPGRGQGQGPDPCLRPGDQEGHPGRGADRLRQQGWRRRTRQGRGRPPRYRARPPLRAERLGVPPLHAPLGPRPQHPDGRAPCLPFHARPRHEQARPRQREGAAQVARAGAQLLSRRGRAGLGLQGQPVHRHRGQQLQRFQRRLLRQQPAAELQGCLLRRRPPDGRQHSQPQRQDPAHPSGARRDLHASGRKPVHGPGDRRGRRQDTRRDLCDGRPQPRAHLRRPHDRHPLRGLGRSGRGRAVAGLGPRQVRHVRRHHRGGQPGLAVLHGQQAALPGPQPAGSFAAARLVRLRPPEERVAEQRRPGQPAAGDRQQHLVLAPGRRTGLPARRERCPLLPQRPGDLPAAVAQGRRPGGDERTGLPLRRREHERGQVARLLGRQVVRRRLLRRRSAAQRGRHGPEDSRVGRSAGPLGVAEEDRARRQRRHQEPHGLEVRPGRRPVRPRLRPRLLHLGRQVRSVEGHLHGRRADSGRRSTGGGAR